MLSYDGFYLIVFSLLVAAVTTALAIAAWQNYRYALPILWVSLVLTVILIRYSPNIDQYAISQYVDPLLGVIIILIVLDRYAFTNETADSRALKRHLSDALCKIDDERRSLVAKLHDELNPLIVLAGIEIDDLQHELDKSPKSKLQTNLLPTARSARDLINQSYEKSRAIINGMETEALDSLGLVLSIESMVEKYKSIIKSPKITFESDAHLLDTQFPDSVATNFFRVAQESLLNAIKHADAKLISISLRSTDKHLLLTIEDNGKGISEWGGSSDGIGIISMKERANIIGAAFDVNSTPHGIKVTLSLPPPPPPPHDFVILFAH